MRTKAPLTLSELNGLVDETLSLTLPDAYWVVAEMSECRQAANGHCYLELVEQKARGGLLAKASAHIWREHYALLKLFFEEQTGQAFTAGLKVLLEVEIDFHSVYGYSLNVINIDPTYTMGDMQCRRKEIIEQLNKEGVFGLNKELSLPSPLQRIAVISSESAAGYGDFCKQLAQSPFRFTHKLFPAIMQGENVEQSVIEALDAVANEIEQWDVVVLIRGGGAVSDLQGFESYQLATNVAQFPLPVFTGIGHERDETVLDYVAHTRFKTPTAVAAYLISNMQTEWEQLNQAEERMLASLNAFLTVENQRLKGFSHSVSYMIKHYGGEEKERLIYLQNRLQIATAKLLNIHHNRLESVTAQIRFSVVQRVKQEAYQLNKIKLLLRHADPKQMLKRGYTMTECNGKIVRNAADLKPGDVLTTIFEEGSVQSLVK